MELCRNYELDNADVHNGKKGNINDSKRARRKGLEMAKFNRPKVMREVHDYFEGAWFNTFDVTGIVNELEQMAYAEDCTIDSIDDIDPDIWDSIVEKHDTGTFNIFA